MNVTFVSVLLIAGVIQATGSPTRIGEVGRSLSAREVLEIERLVSTNGGKPWLLIAEPAQMAGFQLVQAYCAPTVSNRELRRGPLAFISRQSSKEKWQPWHHQGVQEYAQIAVAGRDFNRIDGDQDINRPFRLKDKFTDEELVDLVRFVRSSPTFHATAVQGTWPFLSVGRESGDLIVIRLRKNDSEWQEVNIRKKGESWAVVDIGSAIR
jgi:hypothetical protein